MLTHALLTSGAAATGSEVALVVLSGGERMASLVPELVAREQAAGETVLAQDALRARLTGVPDAHVPDEAALEHMLAEAREREARFDNEGANAVRAAVLSAYEAAVWPTATLRQLAAQAAQDMASALLTDGKSVLAARAAAAALVAFPEVVIDPRRYAPAVRQLFATAALAIESRSRATLTVSTDGPGTLYVDGRAMGEASAATAVTLTPGPHRVWLQDARGVTLPERIDLPAQGATLTLATGLAGAIQLWPTVTLACTDSCVAALVEVGRRAGVPRVLGVRAAPSGDDRLALTRVEVETGVAASEEFAVTSLTHATPVRARFSPLYLLPFGGAQLVQARPYHAAAYLAVQAALVGWHVVALRAHR
ncbi:MAG: hypothetical protein AAB426_04975, partial [Myxococcota bacterium]